MITINESISLSFKTSSTQPESKPLRKSSVIRTALPVEEDGLSWPSRHKYNPS
ncbi:hypothetical protein DSO57_1024882 [Entomophthora muscae]|uniref:Uncharacterized protein n=1 Tax=Entomophthora muscae TaxID=34485 RepID=A0ACC2RTI5_9FUNG|nr:hypothetical protein DSO57_1024882 [Entomophthora muscae]